MEIYVTEIWGYIQLSASKGGYGWSRLYSVDEDIDESKKRFAEYVNGKLNKTPYYNY